MRFSTTLFAALLVVATVSAEPLYGNGMLGMASVQQDAGSIQNPSQAESGYVADANSFGSMPKPRQATTDSSITTQEQAALAKLGNAMNVISKRGNTLTSTDLEGLEGTAADAPQAVDTTALMRTAMGTLSQKQQDVLAQLAQKTAKRDGGLPDPTKQEAALVALVHKRLVGSASDPTAMVGSSPATLTLQQQNALASVKSKMSVMKREDGLPAFTAEEAKVAGIIHRSISADPNGVVSSAKSKLSQTQKQALASAHQKMAGIRRQGQLSTFTDEETQVMGMLSRGLDTGALPTSAVDSEKSTLSQEQQAALAKVQSKMAILKRDDGTPQFTDEENSIVGMLTSMGPGTVDPTSMLGMAQQPMSQDQQDALSDATDKVNSSNDFDDDEKIAMGSLNKRSVDDMIQGMSLFDAAMRNAGQMTDLQKSNMQSYANDGKKHAIDAEMKLANAAPAAAAKRSTQHRKMIRHIRRLAGGFGSMMSESSAPMAEGEKMMNARSHPSLVESNPSVSSADSKTDGVSSDAGGNGNHAHPDYNDNYDDDNDEDEDDDDEDSPTNGDLHGHNDQYGDNPHYHHPHSGQPGYNGAPNGDSLSGADATHPTSGHSSSGLGGLNGGGSGAPSTDSNGSGLGGLGNSAGGLHGLGSMGGAGSGGLGGMGGAGSGGLGGMGGAGSGANGLGNGAANGGINVYGQGHIHGHGQGIYNSMPTNLSPSYDAHGSVSCIYDVLGWLRLASTNDCPLYIPSPSISIHGMYGSNGQSGGVFDGAAGGQGAANMAGGMLGSLSTPGSFGCQRGSVSADAHITASCVDVCASSRLCSTEHKSCKVRSNGGKLISVLAANCNDIKVLSH